MPGLRVAGAAVVAIALMTAPCVADVLALNEANIAAAISRDLADRGRNCIDLTNRLKQTVVRPGMEFYFKVEDALVAAGMLMRVDGVEAIGTGANRAKQKTVTYELAPSAKPFYVETENFVGTMVPGLCWSQKILDRVVKWTLPAIFGPLQISQVTYTYALSNIADWSKHLDLEIFGNVKGIEQQVGKPQTTAVTLTNVDWEVAR